MTHVITGTCIGAKLYFYTAVTLILFFTPSLYASSVDYDFYKGKTINYIVATKPGGGYDSYARIIAKHMAKYIPGSTIIVKNIPGAGHIIGANETYLAKPNGLTIGTFSTGLIYSQIIGQPGIKFDLAKYSWIGKANSEHRVLIVGKNTPFKTLKDLMENKEPIKMACGGVGSGDYNETLILAQALEANLKVIPGYNGNEGDMAIMRGEVAGITGTYTGLRGLIKAGEARVLLQIAHKKHAELPDVPLASDIKVSERGKRLLSLVAGIAEIYRLTAAPPNISPGKLEVLRDAYKNTLRDPKLLSDAQKIGLEINPSFGDETGKLVKDAINQPAENLALLKKIIKVE